MSDLEKLRQWLRSYPQWGQEQPLHVDNTAAGPGCFGLFPEGVQVVSASADILGNAVIRCKTSFALHRLAASQEDNQANAQWLLDFQNWVQQQSTAGLAPTFGDDPLQERIWAEKGKLKTSADGILTYVVMLTAQYTKQIARA